MEKVKVQMLSDSLGVSRVTVWKVLNNRPGVSPKTQALVRDAIKKIQLEDSFHSASQQSGFIELTSISLIAARSDTSVFWMKIIDQIVSETNLRSIRLNYIPIDVMQLTAAQLCNMLLSSKTDGIVVINLYNEDFISALSELNLPKVFLDTTPEHSGVDLRGDVILLEGEKIIESITQSMIDRGCRRIGFLGDIYYAKTNALRYKGFQRAMAKNNLPVDAKYCMTGPIDKDSYRQEIGGFLDRLDELPDAFVCVNDYVAFIVVNLLNDCIASNTYPILSGYDNSQEFLLDHYGITTVSVRNDMLGKRIAAQLFFRIENPTADFEEILISPPILFRS